ESSHCRTGDAFPEESRTNPPLTLHALRTLVTPPPAAFHRPALRKAPLPNPQHMLRQIEIVRDPTVLTKGVGRLVQSRLSVGSELYFTRRGRRGRPTHR